MTETTSLEREAVLDPTADVVRVLVENHQRFLAFLQRRVHSRELAEDILQEAFARGIDRAASVRSADSATAWFYRLLRNALADHYRRGDVERRALDAVASEATIEGEATDQELLDTVCDCVGSLVETLKPEYAEAVRRIELEGVELASFAEAQGITRNNAAVRLHRARQALKLQLERACGTCATHGCLDCTCC